MPIIFNEKPKKITSKNNYANIKHNPYNNCMVILKKGGISNMKQSTIKLDINLIEKIKEIQAINGYKSVNETMKHILPKGTQTTENFTIEQPAFTLNPEKPLHVTWNDLKQSSNGVKWTIEDEEATIIYKDTMGVLIRFIDKYDEVYLEYFHFIG